MSEPLRLQVYLARCGLGSRRHCEEFIRDGRVRINGGVAQLGAKVEPGDRVTLDRRVLVPEARKVYLAVNKPPGMLCANSDPQGRPLVRDLLTDVPERTFHVGRLDFQSSGLIFYTNDGEFSRIVAHPSAGIEKDYVVETQDPILEEGLKQYLKGIEVGGERYRLARYVYKTPRKVMLTLVEGKNREIRRVLKTLGARIRRIHRVRVGCVRVQGIPPGDHRPLSQKEVRWFLQRGGRS
ncbi:MAG: rRNA pseudouridine synthase [Spirochaetales bacterium]|nr:rRNA pseudouridine synthase [Spirochaetales bacterium]